MAGQFDGQPRSKTATAAREIKASAHYAYILNGITLDGTKFAAGELVLEGQCLVKDNATGKYEKYKDGAASTAVINGANNITIADQAGLAADTKVEVRYNGDVFTITNAALKTIVGTSTEANVLDLVRNAVNAGGTILDNVANISAVASKLRISTDESGSGQSVLWTVVNTVAADLTAVEKLFGLASGTSDTGTGAFPEGKSDPVILDTSVKFDLKDDGTNPDVIVGAVLVHGAVHRGMLKSNTAVFEASCKGIRFV
ncbi:hypothetical protein ACF5W4_11145 [Bacillota bacterium Lsc_1132]